MSPAVRWLFARTASAALVVLAASVLFGGVLWISPASPAGRPGGPTTFAGWLLGFWGGVVAGDLGQSHRGYGVADLVVAGASRTLPLTGAALVLTVAAALGLALVLRALPGPSMRGPLRGAVQVVSLLPVFLLAYAAVALGADYELSPATAWLAAVVVLGLGNGTLAEVLLHLEAEVASLAERDFLYAARARGASVLRHAAPSLLLPVLGIAVGRASALLGGALIAEWVLSIPGWGYYSYAAARNDDPTLLVAIAVAATSAVAVLRLGAEGLRLLVDPRIRRASLAPAAGGP